MGEAKTNSGQRLSHYRLVEKIGEGGMGVVWRAEDTVLGRDVAVKVLAAEVALDEKRRQMFLDEARLASSVSDARIVQVHELGREGELDFIVMEYVEGKPLNRILHGRPLPPDKVALIGEQVARALSRAHRKGLLHRDLKPANIMVTPDGDVKVVDFGLATLLSGSVPTRDGESRTLSAVGDTGTEAGRGGTPKQGGIAGTLPYMSPEQVRGERLDARSDIFSLGVVLYEMTTGQRPFTGATSSELLQEILKGRPVPAHDLVPSVPLDLDRIIQKTLAARTAERYQTMDDLAVDLKHLGRELESGSSPSYDELRGAASPVKRWPRPSAWALICVGLVACLATAGWFARSRLIGRGAATAERTVLILPLEVRGQVDGGEYVGRAFAEALAVNLAGAKNLEVLPVPDSMGPRGSGPTPTRAAMDAGAGRVLTGALTRHGETVLASLSVLDAGKNRLLWGTERESREELMPALAVALAREMAVRLGGEFPKLYDTPENALPQTRMATSPLGSEALGAVQRHETKAALDAARRLIDEFPGEPNAHAIRVQALLEAWHGDMSPTNETALEEGIARLEKVDPGHPQAEIARGFVEGGKQRLGVCIGRFTRVLARNDLTPELRAQVLMLRGWNESLLDQTDAGIHDLEDALRLTPTSGRAYAVLANTLQQAGRGEEALVRGHQAVSLAPSDPQTHHFLAMILLSLKRFGEAVAPASKACEVQPSPTNCAAYALALHGAGRASEAIAVAEKTEGLTEDAVGDYNLACFWARAGRRKEALGYLRRAARLGLEVGTMRQDSDLASLHGDPEFEALAAEVESRARNAR